MRIDYFPNGEVHVFNDYKGEFKRFLIEKSITAADIFEDKSKINASPSGITSEKRKDVMSLLKYLTPDAKKYYEIFLKTICTQENKNKH